MESTAMVTEKSGWASLIGCLGAGTLVIGALVAVFVFVKHHHEAKSEEMGVQWLAPWTKAISEGRTEEAWDKLTTEGYRKDRDQAEYLANYAEASAKFGKLVSAEILKSTGTKQPGREPFETVHVQTFWGEKKTRINIIIELAKGPDGSYRQDGGYTAVSGIHDNPGLSGKLPEGPW